jgi:hypothetical protein
MGVPEIQLQRERWWWPIPDPGDPAPFLREWLKERVSVEDQAVLARAALVHQKATLAAKLDYLNQVEVIAGKYMK